MVGRQFGINIDPDNTAYWNNKKVNYTITVKDKQDGSTVDGSIDANKVKVKNNDIYFLIE